MSGRAAAVVLAGAVLVGLAGCGTAAVPTLDRTPRPFRSGTLEAGPSLDPTAAAPGSGLPDEVERAANGFVAASLTRGYPDEGDTAYLRRLRPLMTSEGFGRYERLDAGRNGPRAAADLSAQHLRTRPEIGSVRPDVLAGAPASDRAGVVVELSLVTERDVGGTWQTLTIGPPQEQALDLVDRPGSGWLVDAVR